MLFPLLGILNNGWEIIFNKSLWLLWWFINSKTKRLFWEYYFNNLTLLEISENYEVSRNAVHKQLKEVEEKLKHYEQCLEIYKKHKRIEELTKLISEKEIKEEILELL